MDQPELLHQVMVLMMGRLPTEKMLDAAFIFGRAKFDWEEGPGDPGVLRTAADLYMYRKTKMVCIPGTRGGATFSGQTVSTTYPGPDVWRSVLQSMNVQKDNIFVTAPAEVHTRGDSDSFVSACKKKKWNSVAIVTQPHQMLRAMLAMLKSMELHSHPMYVVPVYPQSVNWNQKVYGSQGEKQLPRREHIKEEFTRVIEGQENGWLASLEELSDYLALGYIHI